MCWQDKLELINAISPSEMKFSLYFNIIILLFNILVTTIETTIFILCFKKECKNWTLVLCEFELEYL
jgi:hypothetical protein